MKNRTLEERVADMERTQAKQNELIAEPSTHLDKWLKEDTSNEVHPPTISKEQFEELPTKGSLKSKDKQRQRNRKSR